MYRQSKRIAAYGVFHDRLYVWHQITEQVLHQHGKIRLERQIAVVQVKAEHSHAPAFRLGKRKHGLVAAIEHGLASRERLIGAHCYIAQYEVFGDLLCGLSSGDAQRRRITAFRHGHDARHVHAGVDDPYRAAWRQRLRQLAVIHI